MGGRGQPREILKIKKTSRTGYSLIWFTVWIAFTLSVEGNSFTSRRHGGLRSLWSSTSFTTESWESILQKTRALAYPIDNYWKRLQERIPENVPFICNESNSGVKWRSEERPQSVHQLRPGDIDVVGAMGDSISSGNAAREFGVVGFLIEDRGVAFSGGGLGTWREFTTLPNILKVFNPNLVGYAVGRGDYLSYNAQLNIALPASIDDDTLMQAKTFVRKMRLHPKVDFESDWKLFTVLTGHSDVCSVHCYNQTRHSPEAHKYELQRGLDYLYQTVPRLFVNMISMFDPTITARVQNSSICDLQRQVVCSCLYKKRGIKESLYEMSHLVRRYQEAEHQLVQSNRYDGRDDFTVELQTFSRAANGPSSPAEKEDEHLIRFLKEFQPWTPECFHFNQKGMALVSVALWNNLMEPVGNKTERFRFFSHRDIKCPTKTAPYIFTKKNSLNYYKRGRQ